MRGTKIAATGEDGTSAPAPALALARPDPAGDPARIALPYAGDDAVAKARAAALIEELGFDAVDVGGLDDSWRQQPGTAAYGADLGADALRAALSGTSSERPSDFRADA